MEEDRRDHGGPVKDAANAFIEEHVAMVEPLFRDKGIAWWEANTTGDSGAFDRVAELETRIRTIYSSSEGYKAIGKIRDSILAHPEGIDPIIARQIESLHLSYMGNQIEHDLIRAMVDLETSIEKTFNSYRAIINGTTRTDNEIKNILRTSTDGDQCREAYLASKQVGVSVRESILELVRLRNTAASSLGFQDHFQMSLHLQEIDAIWLDEVLLRLETELGSEYRQLKSWIDQAMARRFNIESVDLMPWHYGNPFFQEMPVDENLDIDGMYSGRDLVALTRRFFSGLGMNIDPILSRSDLHEREGKCQHAFCIAIDAPEDVRVLVNLKENAIWADTMLHEFGHAVYDSLVGPDLPFLLRTPAHTMSTEAVAMLMGRQTLESAWLGDILGISSDQAGNMAASLRSRSRDNRLLFSRWVLVMVRFEQELYSRPEQDLDTLWWNLVQRYQLLKPIPGRHKPDWASKIHIAVAPVYYQNYQLGDMYSSQLLSSMKKALGLGKHESFLGNAGAGSFLQERLFSQGGTRDWNDALLHATGSRLDPGHFINEMRS